MHLRIARSRPLAMLALLPAVLLAGCMTNRPSEEEKLAAYQTHAGAPVKQIRYYSPIGWEEVDDQHLLLTMRPREVYLMRLSGPCLDYANGSPVLTVSSTAGFVSTGFDRVTMGASSPSCRIEEIRPVDIAAMRALRANAQASGN